MSRIKDTTYLLTDPHFDHENLVVFARPEFNNSLECNETIIDNYKKTVKNNEVVVTFLGDIGDKRAIERIIPSLKGYKILILGNHDKYSKAFYEKYFDEVYDHPVYYHRRIVLSHIPIPVAPGTLNVHGHTHVISLDSENHYNISPELVGYGLVKMKDIESKAFRLEKENNKFLQEWYADIQLDKAHWDRVDLYTDSRNLIDVPKTKILMESKHRMRKEMPKDVFRPILSNIRDKMRLNSGWKLSKLETLAFDIVESELRKNKKLNSD